MMPRHCSYLKVLISKACFIPAVAGKMSIEGYLIKPAILSCFSARRKRPWKNVSSVRYAQAFGRAELFILNGLTARIKSVP